MTAPRKIETMRLGLPNSYKRVWRCKKDAEYDQTEARREHHRFYTGKPWRALRAKYLGAHPGCERCGKPASIVHHRRGRWAGELDWDNLEAVCTKCHGKIHGRWQ